MQLRAGKGGLVLYLAAWLPVSGLLATLLVFSNAYGWYRALGIAVPLSAVYVFVGFGVHYLCRGLPLETTGWGRLISTVVVSATIAASLWISLGRAWIELLVAWEVYPTESLAGYAIAAPIVGGVGGLLFLLAVVLHYLVLTFQASREAETQALKYQLLSRDAELKTLRAQLHPHFLFNSLNSINSLIGSDPKAARRTCVLLGEFLRTSLTFGARDRIELTEEVALSERLLSIEKVRFGSRLEYDALVEGEAGSCLVPPLILQPLVENAVTHGIAGLLDGGRVRVEGRRNGSRLELVVRNPRDSDSPGKRGAGVGLANVKRRLATLYGKEGAVRVYESDEEFRVELTLPAETQETNGTGPVTGGP